MYVCMYVCMYVYVLNFVSDIFVRTNTIKFDFVLDSCVDFRYSFSLVNESSKNFIFVIVIVVDDEKTLPAKADELIEMPFGGRLARAQNMCRGCTLSPASEYDGWVCAVATMRPFAPVIYCSSLSIFTSSLGIVQSVGSVGVCVCVCVWTITRTV